MAAKRVLVQLSPSTIEAVELLRERGFENERFGCEPGSTSETLRRLIIVALEHHRKTCPAPSEGVK